MVVREKGGPQHDRHTARPEAGQLEKLRLARSRPVVHLVLGAGDLPEVHRVYVGQVTGDRRPAGSQSHLPLPTLYHL